MIFGRTRKRAHDVAIAALRPLISVNQMTGGLSTMMYFDPYVLGYLTTTVSLAIKLELKGKASQTDVGLAIQDAFTEVCNVNGAEATIQVMDLVASNDPEYARGSDEASVALFYAYQVLKNEAEEPIVIEAEQLVHKTGGSILGGTHRDAVGGSIILNTFHRHIGKLRAGGIHA